MKEILIKVLNMDLDDRKKYMTEHGDYLLDKMTRYIGSPDDELRDKLIYRLFIELLSNQLLTHEQMINLAQTISGQDYLYKSIGEKEEDSVFTRSFSALWLTALINVDAQLNFLSDNDVNHVLESSSFYLGKEMDIRGFVEDKGWALAISNGADLSTAVITHPAFELRLAPLILQGLKDSFWKGSVYVDDEDERFVRIIEKLIKKDYPETILIEWVEQVFDKLQFYVMNVGYTPQYFKARTNTLHFMKNLYFLLKFSQEMPELKGVVSLLLSKWMKQA